MRLQRYALDVGPCMEVASQGNTRAEAIARPQGQKRPADTLANALHVARLATGEAEEAYVDPVRQAAASAGGQARAKALDAERRREIAQHAAKSRHGG